MNGTGSTTQNIGNGYDNILANIGVVVRIGASAHKFESKI